MIQQSQQAMPSNLKKRLDTVALYLHRPLSVSMLFHCCVLLLDLGKDSEKLGRSHGARGGNSGAMQRELATLFGEPRLLSRK